MPETPDAPTANSNPFRILLIEDDMNIARMIRANIDKARMQYRHAINGRSGLVALEEQQPHLVLLDLMLPDMNGYEICSRIRQISNVPIIMVTARTENNDQMRGLQCGADDYITKPFDPSLLMARIASQLRRAHRYNIAEENESQDWAKCQACGYMGPPEKFEEIDDRFQLKHKCPHCGVAARDASAFRILVS
jgi:DNA-binding response OmpR family regulator